MTRRVAIVGLNHYHVTGWAESLAQFPEELNVVARYDPDPIRNDMASPDFIDPSLSRSFPDWMQKLPFYDDLDALIRIERPDLALVTMPNRDAAPAIAKLAKNGIHLLVDKPGAIDARRAEAAFGAADAVGVKTAVAFTRRYGRPWQDAAQALKNDRLGSLLSAEAIFVTSSVNVRNPLNLIFQRELMGGGILHWLGVHDVDLLLWLAGQPIAEVQAMAANTGGNAIDVEDTISVGFRFASGALGTMHFAYALPRSGGDGFLAMHGSEATVRIEPNGDTIWTGPGTARNPVLRQTSSAEIVSIPGYGNVGAKIIDDLLQAIELDREPLATGRNAVSALRVIDAIYEAVATGRRVAVSAMNGAS